MQIRLADAETDLALAREKALALDGALIDASSSSSTTGQTLTEGSTTSNPNTSTGTSTGTCIGASNTDTGSSSTSSSTGTSSGSVWRLDALRLRHDAESEQRARELAEQQV